MNENTHILRKVKATNFTIVDNGFIRNVNLSWKAKGILLYLLHLPDNWNFNYKHLESQASDGQASLASGIKELKENNYIKIVAIRDNGKIQRWEWTVFETPYNKEDKNEKPDSENPNLVNLDLADRPLLNTNPIPIPKENKKCATKGDALKFIRLSNSKSDVRTTDEEHATLIEKYGPDLVATAYQELLDWKSSKAEVSPKELLKHTDYRRLTKWVIASLQEKNDKSPAKVANSSNKDLALKVAQKFDGQGGWSIYAGPESIEFNYATHSLCIKYTENSFKDQVFNKLRKMNLPLEGL